MKIKIKNKALVVKLVDERDGETVCHCNLKENADLIAFILDFDAEGKVFDWYEQHIAQTAEWYKANTIPKVDMREEQT